MSKSIDLQQEITNKFITLIENGIDTPWRCPWIKGNPFPINWLTKDSYNGINVLILWCEAMSKNYTFNYWLTYAQAKKLGAVVKKGEQGTRCVFYKPVEKKSDEEEESEVYLCIRPFTLFNVDQIAGLDGLSALTAEQQFDNDVTIQSIKRIADLYSEKSGLRIEYGGNKAFYSPTHDLIRLPNTFNSTSGYVATFAHEIGHSTGHKSRLDRFSSNNKAFNTYKESYAFEELCAELFASFLCAELRVVGEHENHASYLNFWLKALKKDKTFLFKASSAASKAYQYLMDLTCINSDVAA